MISARHTGIDDKASIDDGIDAKSCFARSSSPEFGREFKGIGVGVSRISDQNGHELRIVRSRGAFAQVHALAPALNDDGDFAQKALDVFDAGALFRGFHRCGHRRDIGKVQLGQAVDAMQLRRFSIGG